MSNSVAPWQRYTRWHPCPICGGWDAQPRGRGIRCAGLLSDDGRWAHCDHADLAGDLPLRPTSPPTYRHRLDGPCKCGTAHGQSGGQPQALRKPQRKAPPRPRHDPLPQTWPRLDGAHLAAIYNYQDAEGQRAYSVLRYEWPIAPGKTKPDKTFRQVRWLDSVTWIPDLEGVERQLYRQHEILAAPAHHTVFIAEGEKCVEALCAVGLLATTCSEGSGKWHQATGRHDVLRGRNVVILADQDMAGKEHALQVARDLQGVARAVRILELPNLPPKGDVVEWLDAGGTLAELLQLAYYEPAIGADLGAQIKLDSFESPAEPEPEVTQRVREANARMNERLQVVVKTAGVKNEQVSASARMNLLVIRHELDRNADRVDEHGCMPVYLPALAEKCSTSVGTLGTNLKALAAVGALRREEHYVTNAAGMRVKRLSIGPGPNIDKPEAWTPAEEPLKRGGKRAGAGRPRMCPECGGPHVKVVKRALFIITCQNAGCGAVSQQQVGEDEPVPSQDGEDESEQEAQIKVCSISVSAEGNEEAQIKLDFEVQPFPDRDCLLCGTRCWVRGEDGGVKPGCESRRKEAG